MAMIQAQPRNPTYSDSDSDCEMPPEMLADLQNVRQREDSVVELKELNDKLASIQTRMLSVPRDQRKQLRDEVVKFPPSYPSLHCTVDIPNPMMPFM